MKQRLHIKRSIVMNKKSCISVLRGRSDRFQTSYWSGFSKCTNSALHHSSNTFKHKVCQLQTHQEADGWPQESISSYQRGGGYEQPDFVQGQVGARHPAYLQRFSDDTVRWSALRGSRPVCFPFSLPFRSFLFCPFFHCSTISQNWKSV